MGLLPKAPSWNAVKFLVDDPCNTPWWVYVQLAVPAAWSSLQMLIIPQPEEILEQYLDPSKFRGQSRRKFQRVYRRYAFPGGGPGGPSRPPLGPGGPDGPGGGNRGLKGGAGAARKGKLGALVDSNTTIAEHIPGRQKFSSRRISLTEHVFWTGFNTVERVNWYFLLYGASTNFLYEWVSGVFETSCKFPVASSGRWERGEFESTDPGIAPTKEPNWTRLYFKGEDVAANQTSRGDIKFHFPVKCTAIWTWNFKRNPGESAIDVFQRMYMQHVDAPQKEEIYTVTCEPGSQEQHTIAMTSTNVIQLNFRNRDVSLSTSQQWGDVSFIAEPS